MSALKRLGNLEQAVMEHLWEADGPRTVREVHHALCVRRELAYSTVMTVLRRLACKDLVVQIRDDKAYQYTAARSRDELVARQMVDAFDQVPDRGGRHATLMHFLTQVGTDEVETLRCALIESGNGLSRQLTAEAPAGTTF